MNPKKPITSVIIFAKKPQAGKVKTRLIPALGAEKASELAERMLKYTVHNVLEAMEYEPSLHLQLCVTPEMNDEFWQPFLSHQRVTVTQQIIGDLGDRMSKAAQDVMEKDHNVILIGSDCPELTPACLLKVFEHLQSYDAVMHPASDGGYVLLGLSVFSKNVFKGIPWSTSNVAPLTLKALEEMNFSVKINQVLNDIDEPEDLQYLPRKLAIT